MKLTIVIVNYNVKHFLEQCLLSVEKAIRGMEAEVYVVDNHSVDLSVEMVREKFPWVHLIANQHNAGFSKANNQAMLLATGEYILLLNPDTVIEEDTLRQVTGFMDEHPDAGGLGVRMVDGKGNFLPESKRGLPTPETSFYKIFGFSRLFPRSGRFNRYHLGNLAADEVHEIEILSGAFMLLRKAALDKIGLLDETFFMYGEDIDMSYRLVKAGWKNYYYPNTRIIHYKGESTRKGSLNYVFVFYNAMVIFARKHFSESHANWFSFFIRLAIWLRAGMAVLYRFLRAALLPLADAAITFAGLELVKNLYADAQNKVYDNRMVWIAFACYVLIWCFAAWIGAAYDRPLKPSRIFRPLVTGSAFILVAYSLLPESLRFSRALILIGTLVALCVFLLNRILVNQITLGQSGLRSSTGQRFAVVGSPAEIERVSAILGQTRRMIQAMIAIPAESLSEAGRLDEIIRVHSIDQVVFCARDVSSTTIISQMSATQSKEVDFKIAPPESLYIIGSSSIETSGDVYILDVNSVSKPANRRTRRVMDLLLGILLLLSSPVLIFVVKNPGGMLKNIFRILSGEFTLVGFDRSAAMVSSVGLPALKPGILTPSMHLNDPARTPDHIQKLNIVYSKDYRVMNDLSILWRNLRTLGNQPKIET